MIKGINRAFKKAKNNVILILENTAGSGNELGYTFEQTKAIIDGIEHRERIGIALDTAHAFEAGYDLTSQDAVDLTLSQLDAVIGFAHVYLIHLNDSKTPCGSRKDRHWHIGQGQIGQGMAAIVNHPRLRHVPFIMETPRTNLKEDLMNMRIVQGLVRSA
jgi:deoxyribonuclease-4